MIKSPEGHNFLQAQDGRGLFHSLPSNNKGWNERFFLVSGKGYEYSLNEADPVKVQH